MPKTIADVDVLGDLADGEEARPEVGSTYAIRPIDAPQPLPGVEIKFIVRLKDVVWAVDWRGRRYRIAGNRPTHILREQRVKLGITKAEGKSGNS